MQATRIGSPEAQGQLSGADFRIPLPEDLTAARREIGLVDPEPIAAEEAYRIRMAFGLNQSQFGQLFGVSDRSVINYEAGKAIPEPTLILYGILKQRILREVSRRSGDARGDGTTLADYTIDELKAELQARALAMIMETPLPAQSPGPGPGRPRKPRDLDAPKNPVGRPRKYPRDDD